MKLDTATVEKLHPYVARLCMEIDVSKELPTRVFIQASHRCINQQVIYEDLPTYCAQCSRLGYKASMCGKQEALAEKPRLR